MKNLKKLLALVLSVLMVASCLTGMVFAEGEEITDPNAPANVEDVKLWGGDGGGATGYFGPNTGIATKITVPAGKRVISFLVENMATYADSVNKIQANAYVWNTDYATTVAAAPIATANFVDHQDNQDFIFTLPNDLSAEGEILFVVTYVEGATGLTPWNATEKVEGVTYFQNGVECDAFRVRASFADALPDTKLYAEIDYTKYLEDPASYYGFGNPNQVSMAAPADKGYVTLTSSGGDPYYVLNGEAWTSQQNAVTSDKMDYVVIKYRTSEITAGEFYVGRTDGVGWANPMDKSHVAVNFNKTGNWELAVVDASEVWGNVEGVNLKDFRFDPGTGAGSIDIAYIRFYATAEGAAACVAAEQGTWKETVSVAIDDPAITIDAEGNAFYGEDMIPLTYVPASEIDYTQQVGESYVVDLATNIGTVNNGERPTWPEAGYTVDGPMLFILWGANGYILFESLPFADYNTVEIIVGSDPSSEGFLVGFITDPTQPYGSTEDAANPNMSADLISAMAGAGSEGQPNLSGRGEGAGWNSVERMVQLDISNIDYAGQVALSVGTVAPHTWVIAKVEFKNYYQQAECYTYEVEKTGVVAPEVPFNPADLDLKLMIDGPALAPSNVGNTEAVSYDYDKGYVTYTATGDDPQVYLDVTGAEVGPYMVIKYRATNVTTSDAMECFIGEGAGPIGATDNKQWKVDASGEWTIVTVYIGDLADYNNETNVINHFRFDYLRGAQTSAGESVDVEYIAFFGDEASAEYYAEFDPHEIPAKPTYTVTFEADGVEVAVVEYTMGDTELKNVPDVPAKDGYTGAWESYTLNNKNIVVNAVYTENEPTETEPTETEPTETEPTETEPTETEPTEETTAATEDTTEATEDTTAEGKKGCKSVIGMGAVAVMAAAAAVVALKKKED